MVIKYNNVWSSHISDCYGNLINFIKLEKDEKAKEIINGFSEYSFTHLGYTLKKNSGKGVGKIYAEGLLNNLKNNRSLLDIKELKNLEAITLALNGIAEDRLSDITSNIISIGLIDFTQKMIKKYSIESVKTEIKIWDIDSHSWKMHVCKLPYYDNNPIVLIPKKIAHRHLSITKQKFYNAVIIPIKQKEEFKKGNYRKTSKGYKNYLYKKDIKSEHPYSARFVIEYIRANPKSLKKWFANNKNKTPPTSQ